MAHQARVRWKVMFDLDLVNGSTLTNHVMKVNQEIVSGIHTLTIHIRDDALDDTMFDMMVALSKNKHDITILQTHNSGESTRIVKYSLCDVKNITQVGLDYSMHEYPSWIITATTQHAKSTYEKKEELI